ncbi:DUF465 domain-containing protein [Phaeovibrio sulfidiphilus]|uniref:DUF465 domain-containing protein n=1 Tax=Phaeovibrio sulfidiphilus TaxID=1220600 RepID=A0A8J7CCU1_9PROT|nr:DUF465 domain-containing protein [Phaeovibrio sulfidiphilus]MBE1236139.1 DUF465 domain-containing protein [Phaeovibrio sulfidiphilus]
MDAHEIEKLKAMVDALRREHRDLDDVIRDSLAEAAVDMLQLQRLKKRKLALKDQIVHLETRLIPDIIA